MSTSASPSLPCLRCASAERDVRDAEPRSHLDRLVGVRERVVITALLETDPAHRREGRGPLRADFGGTLQGAHRLVEEAEVQGVAHAHPVVGDVEVRRELERAARLRQRPAKVEVLVLRRQHLRARLVCLGKERAVLEGSGRRLLRAARPLGVRVEVLEAVSGAREREACPDRRVLRVEAQGLVVESDRSGVVRLRVRLIGGERLLVERERGRLAARGRSGRCPGVGTAAGRAPGRRAKVASRKTAATPAATAASSDESPPAPIRAHFREGEREVTAGRGPDAQAPARDTARRARAGREEQSRHALSSNPGCPPRTAARVSAVVRRRNGARPVIIS